ncbi:hypothetical protein MMC11_005542 [Xylographa trunciseda]|nr:hypothetical protein [Xylographa trunciseda]
MAAVTQPRLRGRPAHPAGPTFLTYTPNGRKLITAGSNNVIRVYTTGSDGEPTNIDDCQENNTAVAASNDFFITGSEDGTVCMYSLETNQYEKMLTRCSLPIRDIALSPDGHWAAVASDELTVKIVNTDDTDRILFLRDQPKPTKHLSFHPSGSYLAASCTNGIVYIYSLSTEQPELVRKVENLIRALETDAEPSSKAIWHPDGRAFAAPTATRDIAVVSRGDGERQRTFSGGHMGDITALTWSPNGALLMTAGADRKILLWETQTQKVLARQETLYDYANVINLVWHPHENMASFATSDGEVYIYADFVTPEFAPLLEKTLQPAPFIHDPLGETSGNARRPTTNGAKDILDVRSIRRGTPDSLDEILGSEGEGGEEDDFVIDDDGAGYALGVNGFGKRSIGHLDNINGVDPKRRATYQTWSPRIHQAFQPGSTPWRGNRKYLCLNLIGFVWTVDQDTHHTVTVEFYDREYHRDFHFTDPYLYDKACLSMLKFSEDIGATNDAQMTAVRCFLVLPQAAIQPWCSIALTRPGLLGRIGGHSYQPEKMLLASVPSISLSDSYIFVTTTANYVRVYTLYGTPFRVYRQKSSPTVTCASWRDYVLTMGNGPVGADGSTKLLYTIENVRRDEVCQSEDVVALEDGTEIKSVFFSDTGDPCIYDSTGVLLVLQHWRIPGQARWVPLLDTKLLDRLASGRKEETYWPVAVAQDKFHCIILKGGDKYPYFPRPLLSEFDFKIPVASAEPRKADAEDAIPNEGPRLEESFVRSSLNLSLMEDLLSATTATHAQRADLARQEIEVDKALLQLLNVECREGEERGMKALEIVSLMKDRTGKMIEAAGKVAGRYGRTVLEDKIRELAERRLVGMDDEPRASPARALSAHALQRVAVMDFQPDGSNPDLSWQTHAWETMQGAAAADGLGHRLRLPEIKNRPVSESHSIGGSNASQHTENRSGGYGITHRNNVNTGGPLWPQYAPFEFLPRTAVAGQSLDPHALPGLGTHFMGTSVPYEQHIENPAPPGGPPAVSSPATVSETAGQHSLNNGQRFPCLYPGCARTFGRSADLDRHFKKHVPSAAKFYCHEIGCKFNGKPFYRRDKLRSHERNMHGK